MFALALPFFVLSMDSTWAAPKAAAPKGGARAESADAALAAPDEPELTPEELYARKHRNVKLNYVVATWTKVLQDFAVATNTELVADKVPTGKFSRWDMKFYNRDEALAILNSELKPLNFRLQLKGHHLVLNSLQEFRQEYAPALIRGDHREIAEPADNGVQTAAAEIVVDPGNRSAKSAARNSSEPRKLASARSARGKAIRQTAGDEDDEVGIEPAREPDLESQKPKTQSIRLKARDAVTVSKVIYRAFKAQAELIDDGPRGLQGFLVRRPAATKAGKKGTSGQTIESTIRFAIGIDEKKNQLVIEATPDEMAAVVKLIKTLDVAPLPGQASVRAVATTKDSDKLAGALQPELNRLAVATRRIARQDARRNLADADDEEVNQEDDQPEQKTPAPRRPLRGTVGGVDASAVPQSLKKSLKGEVRVESIPELGILVLIGNDEDVQAVMAVIQEIEKLSTATAPEVKVAFLRHVSSETLAALLTSVYERLGQVRNATVQQSQAISVFPVSRPNAILIVASKADLASVYDLIDELDQPSDPKSEFRVIRLKNAVPGQVVDKVEALFPPQQAATGGAAAQQNQVGLMPRVKIIDDLRTNSVIVQARPRDMNEVAQLIAELDGESIDSVQIVEIFRLEFGVAEEISATITSAIQAVLAPSRATTVQQTPGAGPAPAPQGGGAAAAQANPELKEVKSAILKFRDLKGPDGREIRSGILADIRMNPDFRTNSIIVTAPEASMQLVERLIKQFDRPPAAVAEIKIFKLKNSDATAMQNLLSTMFGIQRTGQQGGQQGGGGAGAQPGVPGLLVADAEDSSSMLIPLRFSVDVRTNSITAVGGAAALNVVESVLLTLDESDIRQRQNEVYKLKNVPAATVATAISQFLQTQRQALTQIQDILSPFEQIEREVIVVPETVSNSLLISATPRYFSDIKNLILQLDQSPRQVVIQALFVEVALDNTDEWGMEVGGQDSILFKRSQLTTAPTFQTTTTQSPNGNSVQSQTILSESSSPGYLFNGQQLGNNTTNNVNPTTVGAQLGTGFATALTNSTLGYPGLLLQAGSQNLNLLLRAVSARNRVEVLSRPLIRTVDNQTANIQVGQQVPIVSGFTANGTTGVNSPVVQQRQIGIILQVTPRITPDGLVVMEVVARKDDLAATGFPLVTSPTGNVTSPIINTQNALAVIAVPSGQTVILGGMITKNDTIQERKVPMLGDIPIIGNAFRYDFKSAKRTELMIFLTPRVIHSDEEAEMIKEIEMGRLNFIESEAERVHGPLHGISVPYDGPTGKNYGFPIPPTSTTVPSNKKGTKVPAPPAPTLPLMPSDDLEEGIPAPGLGGARGASRDQSDDEDLDAAFIQTNYRVPAKKTNATGRASVGPPTSKAALAKAKLEAAKISKKPQRNSDEDER